MRTGIGYYPLMSSGKAIAVLLLACMALLMNGCGGGGGAEIASTGNQGNPSPATGVNIVWDPPLNLDGSPVTDLTGYNVYYADTSPITVHNSQVLSVDSGNTEVAISNLSAGTYYVAVTAVYTGGVESYPTQEVATVVN